MAKKKTGGRLDQLEKKQRRTQITKKTTEERLEELEEGMRCMDEGHSWDITAGSPVFRVDAPSMEYHTYYTLSLIRECRMCGRKEGAYFHLEDPAHYKQLREFFGYGPQRGQFRCIKENRNAKEKS